MNNKSKNQSKLNIQDSALFFDILVLLMLIFSFTFSLVFKNADRSSITVQIFSYLCAPLSIVLAILLLSLKKREKVAILLIPKASDKIIIDFCGVVK